MTWFKVDDSFYDHPKVFDLPDCAVALWVRAGCWAARNLTDGKVPSKMPARLCDSPELATSELISRGLWEEVEDGFQFRDWTDYQPSAERVKATRKARAEAGSRGGRAKAAKNAASKLLDNGQSSATNMRKQKSAPTRPDPIEEAKASSSSETAQPPRPEVLKLCEHLVDRMVRNGYKKPDIGKKWLDDARLMLDNDGRDFNEAMALIDWSQDSTFWRSNIKSMTKFRAQYDTLRLQRQDRPKPAAPRNDDNPLYREAWS